jgi:hypothetical protein
MKSLIRKVTSANKRPWAVLIIFVGLLLLMRIISTPGSAQSRNERLLENKVPTALPFTISMKKEKENSFKDLQNEGWLREFELELTNTGDKPIYFFYLTLVTDVQFDGSEVVFPLTYGRAALGDIVTKAGPDDIPIKPGESYVLKPDTGPINAWERSVKEQRVPQARKLKAVFQELSFGDGTGYFGNHLYPPAGKRKSAVNDLTERVNRAGPAPLKWPREQSTQSKRSLTGFLSTNIETIHNRPSFFRFSPGVSL